MKNSGSEGHSLPHPTLVANTQQGIHFAIRVVFTHVKEIRKSTHPQFKRKTQFNGSWRDITKKSKERDP
jgi:hypothetical protein